MQNTAVFYTTGLIASYLTYFNKNVTLSLMNWKLMTRAAVLKTSAFLSDIQIVESRLQLL